MSFKINREDDGMTETHDINMTPFIDVMLVLLIIFMLAAPLATVDIKVELPTSSAQKKPRPDAPVFITIKSDLSLAIGDDMIQKNTMAENLDRITKGDKETRLFLRADKTVEYGDLITVMNDFRTAGYLKIALVGLSKSNTEASTL